LSKTIEIDQASLSALIEAEVPTLTNFLIGFVSLAVKHGEPDIRLGGSGTLVTIDGAEGILTAGHVTNSLKANRYIGVILASSGPTEPHRVSFKAELSTDFILPTNYGPTPNRPDLGFLVPPPDVLSSLRARKSFYNLSKRQAEILQSPPSIDLGLWVLSGLADEWTTEGAPARQFSSIKNFRGQHGVAIVTDEYDEGDCDYLIYEALYNDLYEGPERFGGYSGGGLWQLLISAENGPPHVIKRVLSGVAFYESELKTVGNRITRDIVCHGRRSVYKAMVEYVRSQKAGGTTAWT
jgi:hypothetical protein